jgi:hypothetical protein
VLQLGDGELQIGDLGIESICALRGGDHHRLQRGNVIGQ